MRLSILIPVFNEERTLVALLAKVDKILNKEYELIIVNDASTDSSLDLIKEYIKKSRKQNVRLINHDRNKGKGAGIKSAIKQATGKYFVIQDADLEYDPSDIPRLLENAERNNYRVVYGSRFKGKIKGMATANYYANKFYNFLLRRLYDTSITDMHTCYKLVETKLLADIKMETNGFGYAPELASKILRRGIVIHEVPISFKGRTKKEGKKIGLRDGIECTTSLLRYRFSGKAME